MGPIAASRSRRPPPSRMMRASGQAMAAPSGRPMQAGQRWMRTERPDRPIATQACGAWLALPRHKPETRRWMIRTRVQIATTAGCRADLRFADPGLADHPRARALYLGGD